MSATGVYMARQQSVDELINDIPKKDVQNVVRVNVGSLKQQVDAFIRSYISSVNLNIAAEQEVSEADDLIIEMKKLTDENDRLIEQNQLLEQQLKDAISRCNCLEIELGVTRKLIGDQKGSNNASMNDGNVM